MELFIVAHPMVISFILRIMVKVGIRQHLFQMVLGKNLFIGGFYEISISSDSAKSWRSIDIGMPLSYPLAIAGSVIEGDTLIAISTWTSSNQSNAGVSFSKNNGNSWSDIRSNLPLESYYSLVFFKKQLFVGMGGYGIWKIPVSEIGSPTSIQKADIKFSVFSLSQNYPNPFNPTTTIQFSLPVEDHVRLLLFNTLGQLVEKIIDGRYNAGIHNIELNGFNLSSGLYLYKMETYSGFTQTKKLILLK